MQHKVKDCHKSRLLKLLSKQRQYFDPGLASSYFISANQIQLWSSTFLHICCAILSKQHLRELLTGLQAQQTLHGLCIIKPETLALVWIMRNSIYSLALGVPIYPFVSIILHQTNNVATKQSKGHSREKLHGRKLNMHRDPGFLIKKVVQLPHSNSNIFFSMKSFSSILSYSILPTELSWAGQT